jgi:sterol desaturase/sphingolipid hydroxylase (fatty acid hydroxylase superfamily)
MERHWLTRPATIRKLWVVFIAILVATVAVEPLVTHEAYFGIDGTFAFNAWYGFVACVALIVIAKLLGLVLKRPDTYYDEQRND